MTMTEPLGYGMDSQNSEFSNGSPGLVRSNSMSRPSSKVIYSQRKDYAVTLLKQQSNFQHRVEQPSARQNCSSPSRPSQPPPLMQAMFDFQARNHKELTVTKGELLEILDQRRKWWLARNRAGEQGYIPNNIVGPTDQAPTENSANQMPRSSPGLQQSSTPAEVTAWLRDMGFSKITVKCLGVLRGHQLLGMSEEEITTVCPEEARHVFFKLSAIKSTLELGPCD